jgi:hypothetical protein
MLTSMYSAGTMATKPQASTMRLAQADDGFHACHSFDRNGG